MSVNSWPPPAPTVLVAPAGWYDDPLGPGRHRYFDGHGWTHHLAGEPARVVAEPAPTLPLRVGGIALAILIVSLLVEKVALGRALDGANLGRVPSTAIAVVCAYGPILGYCWYVARCWGTGVNTIGLRWRWVDTGWGLVGWVGVLIGNGLLIAMIQLAKVPFTSNVESLTGNDDRPPLLLLVLLAVVIAPLVEETVFRGVILRALRSRLSAAPAVAIQGLLFGLAHADTAFGWGNIGLVIVLSWAGIAFGTMSTLLRRNGANILTHAVMNAAVVAVVWTGLAERLQEMNMLG